MFFSKLSSFIALIYLFSFNGVYAEQCNAPEMRNTSGFSCEQKWNYYNWLTIGRDILNVKTSQISTKINGEVESNAYSNDTVSPSSATVGEITEFIVGSTLEYLRNNSSRIYALSKQGAKTVVINTISNAISGSVSSLIGEWFDLSPSLVKEITPSISQSVGCIIGIVIDVIPYPIEMETLSSNIKVIKLEAIASGTICIATKVAEIAVNSINWNKLDDLTEEMNNLIVANDYLNQFYRNGGYSYETIEQIAKSHNFTDSYFWGSDYSVADTQKVIEDIKRKIANKTRSDLLNNIVVVNNTNTEKNINHPNVFQSPIAVMQGRTTVLIQTGKGFTPDSVAEFHVSKPDGTEYDVQSIQIKSDGEFRVEFTSTANRTLGTYKWWVVDTQKGKSNEAFYQILPANSTAQALHGYVGITRSLDPIEQPKVECLPDFVTTKSWLSDSSSKDSTHKVTFKAGEKAYAHGIIENQGCGEIPEGIKGIKVMFLISKGEHEDAHDKWNKVGKKQNIKREHLGVGTVWHESTEFNVPDKAGKYNIVVCADRTKEQENKDGDVIEKHKSNNCSTEAVFTVLPNPSIPIEEIKINHKPEGSLTVSCDSLIGWARDRDVVYPVDVSIYDGTQAQGKLITTFKANSHDTDVDNHAFRVPTPNSLKDKLFHLLHMYVTDPEDGSSHLIGDPIELKSCDLPIKTKEFTISNTGNADLVINSITPSTPANWLTINPTSLTISPNASNKITVQFNPKYVPDGQQITYLNISSNDPEESSKMYSIKASGQGVIVDSDGDGYSDLIENEFNSNPNDPEDTPVTFKCKEVVIEQFLDTGDITLNIPNLAVFIDEENRFKYFRTLFRYKPEYSYLDPTLTSLFFELDNNIFEIFGDTCASATVSAYPDWKVHIPRALFNGESLWGDFDFSHKQFAESKKIVVRLNKFGVHLK